MQQNDCIKFSQSASFIIFTPPFHQKLPYDFSESFFSQAAHVGKLRRGEKFNEIYIFLVHSTCKYAEKFFIFPCCCTSQCHEICWWLCKLHMFGAKSSARMRKQARNSFLSLTFPSLCTHMHASSSSPDTTKKSQFFHVSLRRWFSSVPFFALSTLSRLTRERKIRGERGALSI
jgi:hypothetical protein